MNKPHDIIQTIFRDSNYHLSLFPDDEIEALRQKVFDGCDWKCGQTLYRHSRAGGNPVKKTSRRDTL